MSEIIYEGPFKDHIYNHVELKRSVGYKYDTDSHHLKRFDKFTLEKYPLATELTKEIVLNWCSKKSYEAQANQCSRASVIRQFGKYLDSIGVKAYIIPKGYFPKGEQYNPYIYTDVELTNFFSKTEKCKFSYECPNRHLIMPVFFRMIYMCGLRVSEARLLKVNEVDLDNGILTINQSKKDNSRLVPMSASLTERCRIFSKLVHPYPKAEDYYFPALDGRPMTVGNIYKNFRRFLWGAGISHGGRGQGPRIHDFRHTFAVHRLKKWAEDERDLTAYLPVLKAFLGHDSFHETAYYLRLTADVFPYITLKLETEFPSIIPELEGDTNETY
ncbi:tyrosine-type recombinase/integrase [Anaerobacillus isosaccharinicus]|uniref:Integrase n=1 Tax=Anaerobacillus isosaccharinicus TaxID=1532552 RepID=A0A1S2M3L6_9BACI|nr:tyrosine-type recombinase/integrase [Anaerobacillus isosaccharinicus]MBA5588254.1 tyrosine-type recombinase/integrase [Anaerobacillus isosaccharinicus]QOY38304.1 tyrosine-type recombinase/integrase [Anaerobacillus isosaccharinicus]